ncbi:MAG: TIGR01212 family radical SAM protein [Lentisphaerae bacterium GWF2_52_8]|nr:MAG: TIGR01212 family radical SAM protein [Lentisphaerae bacterium GWF2_52_8]
MSSKLYLFSDYLRGRFGRTLHKIPVAFPVTCPNRAADASGGCIYCDEAGARAGHLPPFAPISEQVRIGVRNAANRYGAKPPYIAYFHAFTSTNAPLERLRGWVSETLDAADFSMLIFSTRPDCLPENILDFLSDLALKREVWLELGVQSAHDATLKRINRGHDFACVEKAVRSLSGRGIKCAAHVILGLPGEGLAEFRETAARLSGLPFSGIKLHNLLVLEGTPLADMWRRGELQTMDEHEYVEALVDFLQRIPRAWPVLRLISEAPEKKILAPRWTVPKAQFIDLARKQWIRQSH